MMRKSTTCRKLLCLFVITSSFAVCSAQSRPAEALSTVVLTHLKPTDYLSLFGKSAADVKSTLGAPAKKVDKNEDGQPEWGYKLKGFESFSVVFENGKVSSFSASVPKGTKPEKCMKLFGLTQSDWKLKPASPGGEHLTVYRYKTFWFVVDQMPSYKTTQIHLRNP